MSKALGLVCLEVLQAVLLAIVPVRLQPYPGAELG